MPWLAAAVPYIMAATAVVGAVSAVSQANSAKKAAAFNEEVTRQNAQIARTNAASEAQQQERVAQQRLGAIRAAQGKSGGQASEGSVLDVLGDVASQNELERQNILYRGELAARGYNNTASLDRASGSSAATSGYLKAGSELLSGTYRTYDAFTRMN